MQGKALQDGRNPDIFLGETERKVKIVAERDGEVLFNYRKAEDEKFLKISLGCAKTTSSRKNGMSTGSALKEREVSSAWSASSRGSSSYQGL